MLDYFKLYLILNLLATLGYGAYIAPTSVSYKDHWKTLTNVVLLSLFGMLAVVIHSAQKVKE